MKHRSLWILASMSGLASLYAAWGLEIVIPFLMFCGAVMLLLYLWDRYYWYEKNSARIRNLWASEEDSVRLFKPVQEMLLNVTSQRHELEIQGYRPNGLILSERDAAAFKAWCECRGIGGAIEPPLDGTMLLGLPVRPERGDITKVTTTENVAAVDLEALNQRLRNFSQAVHASRR